MKTHPLKAESSLSTVSSRVKQAHAAAEKPPQARLNVELPASMLKALKQEALDQDKTLREIIENAIKQYLAEKLSS